MSHNQPKNIETYRRSVEIRRIGNSAVRRAQEENRKLGVPNVYLRNGRLYYELPNGELTRRDLFRAYLKTDGS